MKINQTGLISVIFIALITLVVTGLVGGIVWKNISINTSDSKNNDSSKKSNLSLQEIRIKFNCDRVTADVQETDIFCGNPTFYNNPKDVSVSMYYEHLGCEDRLKNPPAVDSDLYQYYETCLDKSKLDSARKDLIEDLLRIKSKVD